MTEPAAIRWMVLKLNPKAHIDPNLFELLRARGFCLII